MTTMPNMEKIKDLDKRLEGEYDLDSRLSRYQSTAPELLELAGSEGLKDNVAASHALFVSDFIVTSSEVPMVVDDEARRKSIIAVYLWGMTKRGLEPKRITRLFWIAYNLAIQFRRNDAFMAGRGIPEKTRAMISIYTYLVPYIEYTHNLLGDGSLNFELGIISAALAKALPHEEVEQFPPIDTKDKALLKNLFSMVYKFVLEHNQDTNDNVVLPNVTESKIMYIKKMDDFPLVSTYSCVRESDRNSLKAINEMFKFFKNGDRQNNKLVFLKGRIYNTNSNIILARAPDIDGNPFVIMQSPADEINVSEMMMLLSANDQIGIGWTELEDLAAIEEVTYEEKIIEREKIVEESPKERMSEETKTETEKPEVGLFGRIKRMLFGSGEAKTLENKEKIQSKRIRRKVKERVTKKEEKRKKIGNQLPDFVSYSLGILALADLRLFEEFDTIRESEYIIFGTLESDFENNKTTFFTFQDMEDPQTIASTLDGLDHVIEEVINHYFGSDLQLIPTEIVFLSEGGQRYIISLDGNNQRLVGTLAKTYVVKDPEVYEGKPDLEIFQRRSLHMRTGQLLSARQHTPSDRSIERIYGLDAIKDLKTVKFDYAILPYARGRID